MAVARTSLPSTTHPDAPVRLCYRLRMAGRGHPTRLYASREPAARPLSDGELKRVLPRLHALDVAIARELRAGSVFGQLNDAQLARVLPLLAERPTRLGDLELEMEDEPLRPRVALSVADSGHLHLTLSLAPVHGADDERIAITDGRLLAGSQAYFIRERSAHPIESAAPWELASWATQPTRDLTGRLGPKERDQLVTQLARAGVPKSDLDVLAVRRGAPDRFVARLAINESGAGSKEVSVTLVLIAEYQDQRVEVAGQNPASAYVVVGGDEEISSGLALIERDLAAEDLARRFVRGCRFRYDRQGSVYRATGEAALSALDPAAKVFPPDWAVERGDAPNFVRDLAITTQVTLLEDRGLLDLDIGIGAVAHSDDDGPAQPADAANDEATANALIEMRGLLTWLQSGKRYLRLEDGTYVAPSNRFRQGLRVLEDLGAETLRATVSPLCIGLLRLLGDSDAVRAADDATRAWVAEISGTSEPAHLEPPKQLVGILRDYQLRGLDWLGMLHRHRLTGILADDMGLGKTVQTLALLQRVLEIHGPKPSLVVAPTSVVTVWRDEAARFTPSLRVGLLHGPPKARDAMDISAYDLLITSYGILRRDADRLAKVPFRYVILDEAQAAKNAATQNARAVRRLTSERRLALSGTPIENRPEELWATFDFLAPGFLGNLGQFRKRYARPIARGDENALALLRARVQPLILRRLKTEVAKELPPKIESTIRCEMGRAQRALYDHIAGRLRDQVVRKIEKVGIERTHLDILAALTRLRQICCDPALLPSSKDAKTPPSAKLALFEELMREALASERRVVVFSQFVQMQKRLINTIRGLGVDPLWLHGGTRKRDKVVSAFQTPSGPPVIVVSLRAGGTGLTLTRADTVMHYDPWWNPAVERQATDRTHRLGQTQRVTVYKLVCANTIEEKVLALAARKDKLADALISSEGPTGSKQITPDEVLALLT